MPVLTVFAGPNGAGKSTVILRHPHAGDHARSSSEGFLVELVYVGLVDSDYCIRRVREWLAQGGHFVPDDDAGLADKVTVYDNSDVAIRKVLEATAGVIHWRVENDWITSVLAQIPK